MTRCDEMGRMGHCPPPPWLNLTRHFLEQGRVGLQHRHFLGGGASARLGPKERGHPSHPLRAPRLGIRNAPAGETYLPDR